MNNEPDRHPVDWPAFATSIAIILLVCIPLAMFPDSGGQLLLESAGAGLEYG